MKMLLLCLPLAALSFAACGDDPKEEKPAPECKIDTDCAGTALTSCQVATCNKTNGTCQSAPAADGTTCSTGNACLSAEICTAGICAGGTVAAADCGARECGKDACGNSCGACTGSDICTAAGACEANAEDCGEIEFEGCCTATGQVKYCNDGVLEVLDCPSADPGQQRCEWSAASEGYECGSAAIADSSGTFPYLCPGEVCTETCDGRECGFACGQPCGSSCTGDDICSDEGKCIDNPCGEITYEGCCNADSSVTYCLPGSYEVVSVNCKTEFGDDAQCGWDAEEEGYWCTGAQSGDPSEIHPYLCGGETCTETCDDRQCGTVCGQTCANTCGEGLICQESDGTCVTNPCGELTFVGCCDGATVFFCSDFEVASFDCAAGAADGMSLPNCGWVLADEEYPAGYDCSETEDADPAGTLLRACSEYQFDRPVAEPPVTP